MEKEERIKQLKAELEALEGEQKKANGFSAITLGKIKDNLIRCKVNLENIDLGTQDEQTIKTEFQQINYYSYTAMKAIDQDISER
jgi:hypothetical protein